MSNFREHLLSISDVEDQSAYLKMQALRCFENFVFYAPASVCLMKAGIKHKYETTRDKEVKAALLTLGTIATVFAGIELHTGLELGQEFLDEMPETPHRLI